MGRIGTEAVHTQRWPNGEFAGPHYFMDWIYCLVYEAVGYQPGGSQPGGEQPGGGVGAAAVFRSSDGGSTWIEIDRANRPVFTPQPLGCPGVAAVSDGTLLHVVVPSWLNTGGAPANDVRLDYYTFDLSIGAWVGLEALGSWTAKTSLVSGASAPICAQLKEDGSLVVAYVQQTAGIDVTYWRTYSGSWGGQVAVTKVDENGCPVAMVRGAGDRMHTLIWRPAADKIDVTSYVTAAGLYQTALVDTDAPDATTTPSFWPAGQPAYSAASNQVMFPVLHGLTSAEMGVKVIRGPSEATPIWAVDQLIAVDDATLAPDGGGALWYGAPGAVFVGTTGYVMWANQASIVWARYSGGWGAAAVKGKMPALFGGEGVEAGANLSLGVESASAGKIGVFGDARAATSQARYPWYREICTGDGGGGGGNRSWFG